eukprot:tig00001041_g6554.t1
MSIGGRTSSAMRSTAFDLRSEARTSPGVAHSACPSRSSQLECEGVERDGEPEAALAMALALSSASASAPSVELALALDLRLLKMRIRMPPSCTGDREPG